MPDSVLVTPQGQLVVGEDGRVLVSAATGPNCCCGPGGLCRPETCDSNIVCVAGADCAVVTPGARSACAGQGWRRDCDWGPAVGCTEAYTNWSAPAGEARLARCASIWRGSYTRIANLRHFVTTPWIERSHFTAVGVTANLCPPESPADARPLQYTSSGQGYEAGQWSPWHLSTGRWGEWFRASTDTCGYWGNPIGGPPQSWCARAQTLTYTWTAPPGAVGGSWERWVWEPVFVPICDPPPSADLWSALRTYAVDDVVRPPWYRTKYFRSLQDSNLGHTPWQSPEWWEEFDPCPTTHDCQLLGACVTTWAWTWDRDLESWSSPVAEVVECAQFPSDSDGEHTYSCEDLRLVARARKIGDNCTVGQTQCATGTAPDAPPTPPPLDPDLCAGRCRNRFESVWTPGGGWGPVTLVETSCIYAGAIPGAWQIARCQDDPPGVVATWVEVLDELCDEDGDCPSPVTPPTPTLEVPQDWQDQCFDWCVHKYRLHICCCCDLDGGGDECPHGDQVRVWWEYLGHACVPAIVGAQTGWRVSCFGPGLATVEWSTIEGVCPGCPESPPLPPNVSGWGPQDVIDLLDAHDCWDAEPLTCCNGACRSTPPTMIGLAFFFEEVALDDQGMLRRIAVWYDALLPRTALTSNRADYSAIVGVNWTEWYRGFGEQNYSSQIPINASLLCENGEPKWTSDHFDYPDYCPAHPCDNLTIEQGCGGRTAFRGYEDHSQQESLYRTVRETIRGPWGLRRRFRTCGDAEGDPSCE